jgi:hypothetical protein
MADSSPKLIKIPNLPEHKMIPLHNFLFSGKYFHKMCLTFNSSLTTGPRKMKVLRSFKMSGTTHPTTKHHIPKDLTVLHVTLGWNYRVNSVLQMMEWEKVLTLYSGKHGTSVTKSSNIIFT